MLSILLTAVPHTSISVRLDAYCGHLHTQRRITNGIMCRCNLHPHVPFHCVHFLSVSLPSLALPCQHLPGSDPITSTEMCCFSHQVWDPPRETTDRSFLTTDISFNAAPAFQQLPPQHAAQGLETVEFLLPGSEGVVESDSAISWVFLVACHVRSGTTDQTSYPSYPCGQHLLHASCGQQAPRVDKRLSKYGPEHP